MRTELVVVGALNGDMIFSLDHVPDRGETVLGDHRVADGGKGANQAVQASQLGVATALVGKVGEDAVGARLVDGLLDAGVDTRFVGRDPGSRSGIGCVWVSPAGDKRIVVAPGANSGLNAADLDAASDAMRDAAVVLVQMEVPLSAVRRAVALGRAGGATVVLNAAPASLEVLDLLADVDVLVLNRHECAVLSSTRVETPEDANRAADALRELGPAFVVVTLGADGALVASDAGRVDITAVPVTAVDGTGAGDAFCGAFAAAVTRGLDVVSSARVGALAGALCATRHGARPSIDDAGRIRRELSAAGDRRT